VAGVALALTAEPEACQREAVANANFPTGATPCIQILSATLAAAVARALASIACGIDGLWHWTHRNLDALL